MEEEATSLNDDYITGVVYPIMAQVSAILAAVVVITMVSLVIYDHKLVNRISLRLQTMISLIDIWTHTAYMWMRLFDYEGPMCTFIGWSLIFFPLLYIFYNVVVAVNLQLVFLHNIKITNRIEAAYWIGPILLAFILATVPLAAGGLGYSKHDGCYTSGEDEFVGRMIDLFACSLWTILGILYIIIIVVLVMIHINRESNHIKRSRMFQNAQVSQKAIRSIKMLTYRVILYPIIVIISQTFTITNQLYYDFTEQTIPVLRQLSYICTGLVGALNFVAFFLDPTVHTAIKKVFKRIYNKAKKQREYPTKIEDVNNIEMGQNKPNLMTFNNSSELEHASTKHFIFQSEDEQFNELTKAL
ncbi:hypothetical protein K502DRAFT_362658 [Neoconidiobolus thromboides FSU 785]|nr:hypothetical protein K502DRAFT_362658 [Neoconidiobolus thromboides FSU 785]